jgi:hypothetical protein
VDDAEGYDARRHPGERAKQQCDDVALAGGHFLADNQPEHGEKPIGERPKRQLHKHGQLLKG